jgi:hypothetical protein
MKYRYSLAWSAILTVFIKIFAPSLKADAFDNVLPTLLTSSSVVFAIIGAWIAVIYPELLSSTFKNSAAQSSDLERTEVNTDRLSTLVLTGTLSAITLAGVIGVQVFTPVAREVIRDSHHDLLKWIYIYGIVCLCVTQLYSIIKLVSVNYFFLGDLREASNNLRIKRLRM